MSDITDGRRRLLRPGQRRDPLLGLESALSHYAPVAREAVQDQYARLGREARQGRTELRADRLLRGDAVLLDGDVLIVELASLSPNFVALALVGWSDYGLTLERDRLVPVVQAVGCDPVAAVAKLERAIAAEQHFDRSSFDTSITA